MAKLTWLGHAGFLIESDDGTKVAIDPWTDAPTFPGTDLSGVDVVLLTHGHFDHASSAPQLLKDSGATAYCIFEVSAWLQQNGVAEKNAVGMNKGGTVEHEGWKFTMVHADHSSGCPGPDGGIVAGGDPAGFVIETPDGEVLYHAGDTNVFGDMALISELYHPLVALLPIGGHFTMAPREAAKAVELLGVEHVVPMHFGTFPILTGTPDQLRELLPTHVEVHAMDPGDSLDLSRLEEAMAAQV